MSATGVDVFKEFNENYMEDLKILELLCGIYNFNWLVNKDGKFAFKRKNIKLQGKPYFGFCKACKHCNIRTKDQLDDLLANKKKELEDIKVNLNAYLAKATKDPSEKEPRKFTKHKKMNIRRH